MIFDFSLSAAPQWVILVVYFGWTFKKIKKMRLLEDNEVYYY